MLLLWDTHTISSSGCCREDTEEGSGWVTGAQLMLNKCHSHDSCPKHQGLCALGIWWNVSGRSTMEREAILPPWWSYSKAGCMEVTEAHRRRKVLGGTRQGTEPALSSPKIIHLLCHQGGCTREKLPVLMRGNCLLPRSLPLGQNHDATQIPTFG